MSVNAARNGYYFLTVLNSGIFIIDCAQGSYGWALVSLIAVLGCLAGIRECGWWPKKETKEND